MNIQTILEFVAALAILIVLHELGHFLAARLVKIDVEEFGLGYPPRLLTLFTAGGTRFSLNWLPFGGFCRMKGENDPDVPGGFGFANPWKRLAVLIAGPMMNLLTAVACFTVIINLVGVNQLNLVDVKYVAPGSPAALAGLQEGDIFVKVNQTSIDSTDKLSLSVADNIGKETTLVLKRGDEVVTVQLVPRVDPPEGEGAMGIIMGNPVQRVGFIKSLPSGIRATYEYGKALFGFLGQLIVGERPAEQGELVGLIGMYDMYSQTRESEPIEGVPTVVNALMFFTSISISLGLLNLLPIPALDGGRILFTLPEIIIHRRIPPKYENVINLVSFGLLLILMFYVNIKDLVKIIVER